jgi:ribosomal protein S18 acetylase RimI-like enzyme
MPGIHMRPAEPEDADTVRALLSGAAARTAALGYPNWPAQFPRALVERAIAQRTLFVGTRGDEVVATLTLQWADEMFWGPQPDDAGYLHRLVVRSDHSGAGLGAAGIDWAARRVRAEGRTCLRLDVAADNLPLCSYYERLGFEYRGDATGEFEQADGATGQWKSRRYERAVTEGKRT